MDKKSIQVQIFGMDYSLKSDMNEEYVKMVARYVDNKIRKLSDSTSVKSQTKIAVLTALNIADELFRLREKYETTLEKVETKSKELSESIGQYISQYSDTLK